MSDDADGPKPIINEVASALSPYIRRVVADNGSFMTGPGTNTYLVGIDEIAVIDPGPDTDVHIDTVAGCGGDRIRWILLTHTHSDHAPGTARLKERTGAEVCAFAPPTRPPDPAVDVDIDIDVDRVLADGDIIEATEFRLGVVHTPGHASNHLCYLLEEERTLFTGDHIMEGSTVVIAPPDGDMGAYMDSLERVRKLRLRNIAPGHGHLVTNPRALIDDYLAHRMEREEQIVAGLTAGLATVDELVAKIYAEVDSERHPVARLSVWAHLLKLQAEGRARGQDLDGEWTIA